MNDSSNNCYGVDLEKMVGAGHHPATLGEQFSFLFGPDQPRSSSGEPPHRPPGSSSSQQQTGKRSMDDVLKKLSSKMHISHSPVDDSSFDHKESR